MYNYHYTTQCVLYHVVVQYIQYSTTAPIYTACPHTAHYCLSLQYVHLQACTSKFQQSYTKTTQHSFKNCFQVFTRNRYNNYIIAFRLCSVALTVNVSLRRRFYALLCFKFLLSILISSFLFHHVEARLLGALSIKELRNGFKCHRKE